MTALVPRRALHATTVVWLAVHYFLWFVYRDGTTAPALSVVAMVLLSAVTAALSRPAPHGVPAPVLALGALTPTVVALLVSPFLVPTRPVDFALWPPGAMQCPLIAVVLLGRPGWAVAGALSAGTAVAYWGLRTPSPPLAVLSTAFTPVVTILLAALVRVLFLRADAALARAQEVRTAAAAAQAVRQARVAERDRRVAEVDRLARPVLERIAAGGPLDDDQRHACRRLEALLRDGIRGRRLVDERVRDAADRARQAGVEVVMLDDSDGAAGGNADAERSDLAAARSDPKLPDPAPERPDAAASVRRLLGDVLDAAPAAHAARVVARLSDDADAVATIVVLGAESTSARVVQRLGLDRVPRTRLAADLAPKQLALVVDSADELMLTVRRAEPSSPGSAPMEPPRRVVVPRPGGVRARRTPV